MSKNDSFIVSRFILLRLSTRDEKSKHIFQGRHTDYEMKMSKYQNTKCFCPEKRWEWQDVSHSVL